SVADSAARGSYVSWTDYLRDPRGVGAAGIRVELHPPGTCVVGDIEVRNPAACSVSGSEAKNRGRARELRGAARASRYVSSSAAARSRRHRRLRIYQP